jgi:hypothetical protein
MIHYRNNSVAEPCIESIGIYFISCLCLKALYTFYNTYCCGHAINYTTVVSYLNFLTIYHYSSPNKFRMLRQLVEALCYKPEGRGFESR